MQVEGSALKSRKPTYCYDEGDLQRLQARHSGQALSLQRFKVGCLLLALEWKFCVKDTADLRRHSLSIRSQST